MTPKYTIPSQSIEQIKNDKYFASGYLQGLAERLSAEMQLHPNELEYHLSIMDAISEVIMHMKLSDDFFALTLARFSGEPVLKVDA